MKIHLFKNILLRVYMGNRSTKWLGVLCSSLSVMFALHASEATAASSLLVSASANRSAPSTLAGQAMSGKIYVFTNSTAAVKSVQFYLDNGLKQTEGLGPYDFAGTAANGTANPFDTNVIATGGHTIKAVVTLTSGATETVTGTFTRSAPTAAAAPVSGGASPTSGKKWHPGHYVLAYEDNGVGNLDKINGNPNFKGINAWHYWREIESGKGAYNFNEMATELAKARSMGKQYWLTMMFKTFATKHTPCVPNYMLTAEYQGGQSVRYNADGSVKYCIAKVWVPAVQARLNALYSALGERFDADPNFEGIATSENSLSGTNGMSNPSGYTLQNYTNGLRSGMAALARAFPRSQVSVTVNWVKQQLDQMIPYAHSLGIGIGCPDMVPPIAGQVTTESYAYYPSYYGKMPLAVNVEGGVKSVLQSGRFTLTDLYNFGVVNPSGLRVNYMFWTVGQETAFDAVWAFTSKIKPLIDSRKGFINSACPLNTRCQ